MTVKEEEAAGLREADLWIAGTEGVTYRGLSRTWMSMHFQSHTKWSGFTSDHCCLSPRGGWESPVDGMTVDVGVNPRCLKCLGCGVLGTQIHSGAGRQPLRAWAECTRLWTLEGESRWVSRTCD